VFYVFFDNYQLAVAKIIRKYEVHKENGFKLAQLETCFVQQQ